MKPRIERLPCPQRPGYLTVDLSAGPHAFRLPTWSEATRLAEFAGSRPDGVASSVEYFALVVGVAWHHEGLELEAEYPIDDPTPSSLVRYGRAVERELEEAGYTATDVGVMARALLDAMTARQRTRAAEAKEASRLADFSGPPPAGTSSP